MQLGDALQAFYEYLVGERRVARNTLLAYQRDLTQMQSYATERFGAEPVVGQLGKLFLRGWLAKLSANLKPESINRKLAAARTFFKFMQRGGLLDENPGQLVSGPKVGKRLPAFLGADAAAEVMDAPAEFAIPPVYQARDTLILELLYGCGLRVSELAGLDLDRVDVRGAAIRAIGKGNKERFVPVGTKALDALAAYQALRPQLRHPKTGRQSADALILNRFGRRLSARSIQRLVHRYGALGAGRADLHPHALRHSCATHMLEGGADLRAIQEFLGHTSLSTTQRYTHLSLDQLLKVYDQSHPLAGRRIESAAVDE